MNPVKRSHEPLRDAGSCHGVERARFTDAPSGPYAVQRSTFNDRHGPGVAMHVVMSRGSPPSPFAHLTPGARTEDVLYVYVAPRADWLTIGYWPLPTTSYGRMITRIYMISSMIRFNSHKGVTISSGSSS
jgi:hypothetical protein